MSRSRTLLLAVLLLPACRVEKIHDSKGPPREGLEALGSYPVESATYDVLCTIDAKGKHDADVLPHFEDERADVRTRVRVGRRRFEGADYLRLPAIEVEPGLELAFDIVDKDLLRDDDLGEQVLQVGETWPLSNTAGKVSVTCYGLSGDREEKAMAAVRELEGEMAPEDLSPPGTVVALSEAELELTATHCGLEAIERAYPQIRSSLWTKYGGQTCAVELALRNPSSGPLPVKLDGGRVAVGQELVGVVLRGHADTKAMTHVVGLSESDSSEATELFDLPEERDILAGHQFRIVLRGTIEERPSASRPPGIAALGLERDGTWTWLASPKSGD